MRFVAFGLVMAASATAGLFAIGLFGQDGGGASDTATADGGQQVVAGPGEVAISDLASPTEREPLTVGPGQAGDRGAVAAPTTGEIASTAKAPSSASAGSSSGPGPADSTTSSEPGATSGSTTSTITTGRGLDDPATTAARRSTTTGATIIGGQTSAVPTTTATIPRSTTIRQTTTSETTTSRQTTTSRSSTTLGGSGTVIWQDDFDRFDASTWRREHSTYGDGNNELQCYQPGNVSVGDGKLVLRAATETVTCPNGSTRGVSSGMVRSRGVTFSPGQAIEFRVKLTPADPDDQGGLWPAVWASGWAGGSWPAGGELDWLEVMTAEDATRAMFSMHYAGSDGAHALQNRGVRGVANFSAAWHTVRFDYGHDGQLRWSLDGAPAFAVDAAQTLQGYPAPFDQTIREIKINLALGGRPGPLAAGAVGSTGATFEVDYIRIIQL